MLRPERDSRRRLKKKNWVVGRHVFVTFPPSKLRAHSPSTFIVLETSIITQGQRVLCSLGNKTERKKENVRQNSLDFFFACRKGIVFYLGGDNNNG